MILEVFAFLFMKVSPFSVTHLLGRRLRGPSIISGGFWEVVEDIAGGSKYGKFSVDIDFLYSLVIWICFLMIEA